MNLCMQTVSLKNVLFGRLVEGGFVGNIMFLNNNNNNNEKRILHYIPNHDVVYLSRTKVNIVSHLLFSKQQKYPYTM